MKRLKYLRQLPKNSIKEEKQRDYFPFNTDPAQVDMFSLRDHTEKEIEVFEEEHEEQYEMA